jgi:hypothetical protein
MQALPLKKKQCCVGNVVAVLEHLLPAEPLISASTVVVPVVPLYPRQANYAKMHR